LIRADALPRRSERSLSSSSHPFAVPSSQSSHVESQGFVTPSQGSSLSSQSKYSSSTPPLMLPLTAHCHNGFLGSKRLCFAYRFFGSGVILATSLIHLLEPAADKELGPANTIALGGCISNSWSNYPYAVSLSFSICALSVTPPP